MRPQILVLLFAATAAIDAQERVQAPNTRLTAGTRVRLFSGSPGRQVVGRISSISADSIGVQELSGSWSVAALRDVDSLEVYERSSTAATILGTLGFVAGTTMYVSWCEQNRRECEREERYYDEEEDELTTFKALAFGTAGIGLLLGYALTPPRWHRVPVFIWIAPAPDGGAALHFRVPVSTRWR